MGDQLLIASCAGWFYALDRANGDVLWRFDIRLDGACQFHSEMLVLNDRVIVGTDGTRGNGHALNLKTGDVLWTHPCGSALRTDLLGVGDTVIAVAKKETDELFCLRTSDGHQLWAVQHERPDGGRYGNTPVVIDDRVYYGAADGRVYAYNVADGELLETYDVGGPVATSLLAVDRYLYGATADRIFRLNLDTGYVDASYELRGELDGKPVGKPALLGSSIAVLLNWRTGNSRMVVVDSALTEALWKWTPESKKNFGTIARLHLHDGDLIMGTQGGDVLALDVADGTEQWRINVGSAVRSASFHEGVIYVGTIPGMVHAIRMPPKP